MLMCWCTADVVMMQIEALLHMFDHNGDGVLDFNEFVTFYPEAKLL